MDFHGFMKPFQEKRPAFANHHPLLTSQVQYSKNIPLRQPSVPDTDSERNIVYTIKAVPIPIPFTIGAPIEERIFRNTRTGTFTLHGIRDVGIRSTVSFGHVNDLPSCYTAGIPEGTPEEIHLDIFWGAIRAKS